MCRVDDPQSVQLLEAYLDRTHGDSWRGPDESGGGTGGTERATGGKMTVAEAREILGVDESASRDEIIDAHRRLMQKMHPDRGGSTYLASKINQAKDVLIG